MKRRLSPQQKKALSYQKDRRENFGQNDKASRRRVPLSKAQAQRRLRHKDKQALHDLDAAAEAVPLTRAKPDWRKWPGETLGDNVKGKLRHRRLLDASAGVSPGRARLGPLLNPGHAAITAEKFSASDNEYTRRSGEWLLKVLSATSREQD